MRESVYRRIEIAPAALELSDVTIPRALVSHHQVATGVDALRVDIH
jgi:hypothetical protein